MGQELCRLGQSLSQHLLLSAPQLPLLQQNVAPESGAEKTSAWWEQQKPERKAYLVTRKRVRTLWVLIMKLERKPAPCQKALFLV